MWTMPHETQPDAIQNLIKQLYEHQWMSLTKSHQIMMNILQEMMKVQEKVMSSMNPSMSHPPSCAMPHPHASAFAPNPQEALAKSFSFYTTLMEQWKQFLPQALAMKNPWQNWGSGHPSSSDTSA